MVRAIYDAWLHGRSARHLVAEDLEYVNPDDAIEPGIRQGRSSLRGLGEVYDDVRLEPEEIAPVGAEDVLVIARLTGKAKGSGVPVDTRQGYVWTVRDGTAVRLRWFRQPEQAWRAVGLSP